MTPDPPSDDGIQSLPTDPASESTTIDALRAWVRARHAADLPGNATVASYHSAEPALIELAATEPTLGYRVRALSLLGAVATETGRTVLLEVATDPEAHRT